MSILGTLGAVGAIGGSAIGAFGANSAANKQKQADLAAQKLQQQEFEQSLGFQEKQFDTQQANIAPWIKAGTGAVNTLSGLLSTPGQGLLTPWNQTFQAPTNVTEQNDPGYQFRLQQGTDALQNSAAARGGLLTTGTAKALENYGQGFASNEYQNVYNRALQQYQQSYNEFENNQANTYNRLAGLSGSGQTATAQEGQLGQEAANNITNASLTTGAQQGNALMNAGTATASGYTGVANALSGGLSGGASSIQQALLLQQLMASGGGAQITGAPQSIAGPGMIDTTGGNALAKVA